MSFRSGFHDSARKARRPRFLSELLGEAARMLLADDHRVVVEFRKYLATRWDGNGTAHTLSTLDHHDTVPGCQLAATPFEVGLLHRLYDATLPDGRLAIAKCVTITDCDAIETELQLLRQVKRTLANPEYDAITWPLIVDDFGTLVRSRADLEQETTLLKLFAEDGFLGGACLVPKIEFPPTDGKLVVRRSTGERFSDVWRSLSERDKPCYSIRILTAWLWQVFSCRAFMSELTADGIWLLPDGRIEVYGLGVQMAGDTQEELWEYLLAVAVGDHDRMASAILRLSIPLPNADATRLRLQLKQLVPFREGCRNPEGDLGDALLSNWKVAERCGYWWPQPVLRFHRTLLSLRKILSTPSLDTVRAAVENAHFLSGFRQMRTRASMDFWRETASQLAPVLIRLPQLLDETLSRIGRPPESQARAVAHSEIRGGYLRLFACALIAWVVLVLCGGKLAGLDAVLVIALLLLAQRWTHAAE